MFSIRPKNFRNVHNFAPVYFFSFIWYWTYEVLAGVNWPVPLLFLKSLSMTEHEKQFLLAI